MSVAGAQESYLAWFRNAAELVAARGYRQRPQLRYLGPDTELLVRKPFD